MQKIGILTFVRPCNYGAALQCYALNKVLSNLGADPVTMDYWPEYFRSRYYPVREPFTFKWKEFKERRRRMCVKSIKDKRNKKFENFMENNVKLSTPTARTVEELQTTMKSSGIRKWITGSDQVWSDTCARFDPAYFLDLELPEGSLKYSYAASFGMSQIPLELKDEYKRRLTGYRRYSVREQSGAGMINELFPAEVNVHCDPTLLLTADEWKKVASAPRKDKYILIYHVMNPTRLLNKAAELSKQTGLKVVLFTPYFNYLSIKGKKIEEYGYEPAMDSSPQDFVSLFLNAEYVLTNSFHGTVFSVLFHKKFWSQTQLIEGKPNTRSINLLEKLSIKGRDVFHNKPLADTPIDWEKADAALAEMREEAISYLKDVISDPV